MLSGNDKFRALHNVTAWHEAGYFGKGVKVANGEGWSLSTYNPDNLCSAPYTMSWSDDHGLHTAKAFYEFAPKAEMVQLPFSSTDTDKQKNSFDYIKENGICLMTLSRSTTSYAGMSWLENLTYIKEDTIACISVGNDGETDYNKWVENEDTIAVGAVAFDVSNNIYNASYSSVTDCVDFGALTNVYVYDGVRFEGTSCSCPVLAGMMALVQELFIEKTGKPLNFDRMYAFLKDNAVDLGNDGFDSKEGWGYIILPNPEDVNVWDYQTKGEEDMNINEFKDYSKISDWARDYVQEAVDDGIMQGDTDDNFNPLDGLTREQATALWSRMKAWCADNFEAKGGM